MSFILVSRVCIDCVDCACLPVVVPELGAGWHWRVLFYQEELGFDALPEYTQMEVPFSQTQQKPQHVDPDTQTQVSEPVSLERFEDAKNVEVEPDPLPESTSAAEASAAAPSEPCVAVHADLLAMPVARATVVEQHQVVQTTEEAAASAHTSLRTTPSPLIWAPSQALWTQSNTPPLPQEEEEEEEMDDSLPSVSWVFSKYPTWAK